MAKNEINAFLGTGAKYEGRLEFHGIVRIDGEFSGEIHSDGSLIVGKDATVAGVIDVGQFMCSGRVEAEVRASKKAILHKSADYRGNIVTPVLVIEEGAKLEGEVAMPAESGAGPGLTGDVSQTS